MADEERNNEKTNERERKIKFQQSISGKNEKKKNYTHKKSKKTYNRIVEPLS